MKLTANFFIVCAIVSILTGIVVKFAGTYAGFFMGLRPQTFLVFANTCLLLALVLILKAK